MSLMHRLQALKQRRKLGHGHKLGQAKDLKPDAKSGSKPGAVFVDTPVGKVADESCTLKAYNERRIPSVSSAADVLPSIDYTFDVGELDAAPSLVSSSSFASELTLAELAVDDGLTAWGLPKVVGQDDDDDEHTQSPAQEPVEEELFYDCEETFQESIPMQAQLPHRPRPTASQLTAQMTLTVVYAALLTRSKRTRPSPPLKATSWLPGWL